MLMRPRLQYCGLQHCGLGCGLGIVLAALACALAAPAARAFTIENRDASPYTVPEFNLEEQSRQFRKDGNGVGSAGRYQFDGVFGKGSLEFGLRERPYSNFGPGVGPAFGPRGYGPTRRDFDWVVAPPSSLDRDR
jgi:hypothetical protein